LEIEESMSAKISFPAALVLAALSLCQAHGQPPATLPNSPGGTTPPGIPPRVWEGAPGAAAGPAGAPPGTAEAPAPLAPAGLSRWITYDRPCGCCGPVGGDGPITTEVFLRSGASVIAGGGVLSRTLQTGWVIDGGARSLFFNPARTAAWTVTYGVSNYNYHGDNPNLRVPLTVLVPASTLGPNGQPLPNQTIRFGNDVPGVQIRMYNQTFFNLGMGRDWWIWGPANSCDCPLWRVGFDFGGRYGTANLKTAELRHRTDVIGGVWVALHTDFEIPWGCGWFVAGFRAEWGYTWSDILQSLNNSDLQAFNLLGRVGYRF
jgi:hypothetical protein